MATKQVKRYQQFVVDPLTVDPQTIADKLVFDPITKIEGGTPFYTSKIHIQDPLTNSGKVGDLVLRFDTCDSFGISADVFGKPGVKDWNRCGMYTIMYNKADGKPAPTKRQVNVVDTIEKISEKCVDYIFNNRSVILKDCLNNNARITKTDSKFAGISPFKYRVNETTQEEDREAGPTMIQKIITFKPKRKGASEDAMDGEEAEFNPASLDSNDDGIQFATKFMLKSVGDNGKAEFSEINPKDYEKQRCRITTFVKVESIFMNSSMFKLQLKTKEVIMEVKETNTRKRLYEMFDDIMEANEESTNNEEEGGSTEGGEEVTMEEPLEEVAPVEEEPVLEEVPVVAPSKPKKKKTT